ncbi:hypothetical protein [Streptomyces puniciscabiei]|uniref:hypothetical protein n=1 Tax=Streptomyces puniciscabiei TaxID=164348 RepID=UPI00378DDAB2
MSVVVCVRRVIAAAGVAAALVGVAALPAAAADHYPGRPHVAVNISGERHGSPWPGGRWDRDHRRDDDRWHGRDGRRHDGHWRDGGRRHDRDDWHHRNGWHDRDDWHHRNGWHDRDDWHHGGGWRYDHDHRGEHRR